MLRTGELIADRAIRLIAKKALVVLVIAIGFPGSLMLMPSAANAQDARTATSMAALKDKTAKLGAPRIEGTEAVGNKSAPALYFGSTKMNNNFTVVDEVVKEGGPGMAATLFVKAGLQQAGAAASEEYIRVATSVLLPDGRPAVGTVLGPPALDSIKAGHPYFGEVAVLGTQYITRYEPIKDASGETIGAYFVGSQEVTPARRLSVA
jgi:ABC-type branched-subunit amino acid transport system substrate-binding protein